MTRSNSSSKHSGNHNRNSRDRMGNSPTRGNGEKKGGGGRRLGLFPSVRQGRMVQYGSEIERDFLYLLDYEPGVLQFRARPFTIDISGLDGYMRYMPDFTVDVNTALYATTAPHEGADRAFDTNSESAGERRVMVEVLPHHLAQGNVAQQLFDSLIAWCKDRTYGLEFCWITDRELRAGCYLENVKLLTRHSLYGVHPSTRARIYGLVDSTEAGMPLGKLAEALAPLSLQEAVSSILHMTFYHEIYVPLDEWSISGESPVYMPHQKEAVRSIPAGHPLRKLLQ